MVRYVRLYSDADGESHFEDCTLDIHETVYAPPAPPLIVSGAVAARQFHILTCATGWYGDWHPAPARQFMMLMTGRVKVEVSNGEIREFGPGLLILVEDTEGCGHRTWNTGDTPFVFAVVRLEDERQIVT
jgi:hypothetical protein